MVYVINVPDDLTGYEIEPGDLLRSLLGTVETWLGPDYQAFKAAEVQMTDFEAVRYEA